MSSTVMRSTPFEDAQIEPSNTAGHSGIEVAENTSTLNSENPPTEEVAVSEPEKVYKMIARRDLHKSEMDFLHKVLPIYRHWTSSIVDDLEKYQLLEATSQFDDLTVIAAEEPDKRELEIVKVKASVRHTHIHIREKWVKDFGEDGLGRWPPVVNTPGSSDESLWHRMDLSSDRMRRIRNQFAHQYQVKGEIEQFQWLYDTYTKVIPALEVLIKKLQEALNDPEHWVEYKPRQPPPTPADDLTGPGIPEYARDTPETEALWAAEVVEQEQRMLTIVQAEMEEGTNVWQVEEPWVEGAGQEQTPEGILPGQPPESRGYMDLALRKSMEFAFKAKPIREIANAFGQRLSEMQGDLDPSEWVATGVNYHQAPNQAREWSDDGSVWGVDSEAGSAGEDEEPAETEE